MKVKKITPNLFLEVVKETNGICFCKEYKSSQFYLNEYASMNTHLTAYESSYINSLEDYEIEFEPIPVRAKKNDELIKNIIKIVSDITDVDIDSMMSKKKQANICDARHLAMYFIHEYTDLNHSDIAKLFNRDRSTVVTGIQKIKRMNCSHCPDIQSKCDIIQKAINKKCSS